MNINLPSTNKKRKGGYMKNYQSLFGCYAITVKADNKESAKDKIIAKFNGYKDGSTKKEYIRNRFNMIEPITEVKFINGFWR